MTWSLNKLKLLYQATCAKQNSPLSLKEKTQELLLASSSSLLHHEQDSQLSENDLLEFRYYSGHQKYVAPLVLAKSIALKITINATSNKNTTLLAPSPSIDDCLSNTNGNQKLSQYEFITFRISEIKALQLRKGMYFNPDPYVKISIVPNSFTFASSDSYNSTPMSTSSSIINFSNVNTSINSLLYQSRSSIPFGYIRDYKTKVVANTCFPNWKNEVRDLLLSI